MAVAYGDHFNSNTTPGVAASLADLLPYDVNRRISAGLGHARQRRKTMRAVVGTAGGTSGDQLVMGQFKSGDRLFELYVTGLSESTTYAANLGLYIAGARGLGAVLDADLFASAIAFGAGAIARIDGFVEATTLGNIHRGRTLWELLNVGGATAYTQDPMLDYYLVLTSTATIATAPETIMIEAVYTSGD